MEESAEIKDNAAGFPWWQFAKFTLMEIEGPLNGDLFAIANIIFSPNRLECKAIIDTGAAYNFIEEETLKTLNLTETFGRVEIGGPYIGDRKSDLYQATFNFIQAGHIFTEYFAVLPHVHPKFKVILGTPFLTKCKSFEYYSGKNKFKLIFDFR